MAQSLIPSLRVHRFGGSFKSHVIYTDKFFGEDIRWYLHTKKALVILSSHHRSLNMVFLPPSWVPAVPAIPDVPLCEFMFDEQYGRAPIQDSLPVFICGITGRKISITQLKENVDSLARGMAAEFGWRPGDGDEMSKVIAIFALNTVSQPANNWPAPVQEIDGYESGRHSGVDMGNSQTGYESEVLDAKT